MSVEPRISYSFPQPPFDLSKMRPELWHTSADGKTQILCLRPDWGRLLPAVAELDLVMACAAVGPLSVATAIAPLELTPVPDSSLWVCLNSGLEVDAAELGAAALVMETQRDQTVSSLQWFDRRGEGALKVLATNGTDLERFESLAGRFGVRPRRLHASSETLGCLEHLPVEAKTLRDLRVNWLSLTRTLPEDYFPGQPKLTRLAALRAAGADLAWEVPAKAALAAVSTATLHQAPLGAAVRTSASLLPAGFYPQRYQACGCGTTFFSDYVQLTLRRNPSELGETWVTRFRTATQDVRCVEFYHPCGRFAGGIGLRPEASAWHHQLWNSVLTPMG
jgi:hypothetical protein